MCRRLGLSEFVESARVGCVESIKITVLCGLSMSNWSGLCDCVESSSTE